MKKYLTLNYLLPVSMVMVSFFGENWSAGAAWALVLMWVFLYDLQEMKFAKSMAIANLFFKAHDCKWPNARAEEEAARALAEMEKAGK